MVILFLILTIVGILLYNYSQKDKFIFRDTENVLAYVGATILVISAAILCLCLAMVGDKVLSNVTINQKIEMLEVENADIEVGVKQIVGNYMNYEQQTYTNLNNADLATLVALYPDLKASDLVNKQLTMYYDNKQQVKDLKMERIENSDWKFILYFGGTD